MAQTTIAIIADCDDTLAPDTTGQLLQMCGVDPQDFFRNQCDPLIREGWDPTLAYMYRMVELAKENGPLSHLTSDKLRDLAVHIEFFPGVPEFFEAIKQNIEAEPEFRAAGIRVESYVISGGIGELLRASSLMATTHRIWACDFSYDSRGVIAFPKNVISFTDKTRFLFRINKGLTAPVFDTRPTAVNDPIRADERPVPFENMVYLGDGATDVPAMSVIVSQGGFVIGVGSQDRPDKTWALAYGRRANQTVAPDFREQGQAFVAIHQAVWQRASAIVDQASRARPAPQH